MGVRIFRLFFARTAAVALFLCFGLPLVAVGADSGARQIPFTILHTNDEHSALIPHSPAVDHDLEDPNDPTVGGFARLATAVEEIRSRKALAGEPVLLFNTGDFLGGSAFGWLAPAGHSAELHLMREIGYDVVTIGNHEYDYGPDVLAEYLVRAGYPEAHDSMAVLASNTRPPKDHPLAQRGLLRESAVFALESGITVGVFALIGRDAVGVSSDTGDVEFLDQHDTARRMVDSLRTQGADVVVAVTHSGDGEDRELARAVQGIDVIVGGHSHTALHTPIREGDTIIVQAGYLLKYLGRLELAYDRDTGKLRTRNEENNHDYLIPIDKRFAPHQSIERLVGDYTDELNHLVRTMTGGAFSDIMGTVARSGFSLENSPPLQETTVGNFIADGMRLITERVTGKRVDVALQANGSIRESIVPGGMEHSMGMISFYDIAEVIGLGYGEDGYPGYPIVAFYLTGRELRRALEAAVVMRELLGDTYFLQFSGLRYSFNPDNAVLFTVPVLGVPLPTGMAVRKAELYRGDGAQSLDDTAYVPLRRGDERMYRVVTDSYILSFLPMVGEVLPQLEIVPKNARGEPVPLENMDELVVARHGRQLKVWETVVEYASLQPKDEHGNPTIPSSYRQPSGRINQVASFPLIAVPLLFLLVLAGGIAFLVYRRVRTRRR